MLEISQHFLERSDSLHGLALSYAENEEGGASEYHVVVCELLSLANRMFTLYGDNGYDFLWGTLSAFSSDEDTTVGDVLLGVYDYLESSANIPVPRLPSRVLNRTLPQEPISYIHEKLDWDEVVQERTNFVKDAHLGLDEGDEWLPMESMYHADVRSFQLWLMEQCETFQDEVKTLNMWDIEHPTSDDLVFQFDKIYYDIMWDLTLEVLNTLGEIPEIGLEESLNLWRSRLFWVAGLENYKQLEHFFNAHIEKRQPETV